MYRHDKIEKNGREGQRDIENREKWKTGGDIALEERNGRERHRYIDIENIRKWKRVGERDIDV